MSRTNKNHLHLAVALLLMIPVIFLLFEVSGGACFWYAVTGVPCATCGMTRALTALLAGDLALSLAMHPLLLPFLILTVYLVARLLLAAITALRHQQPFILHFARWERLTALILILVLLLTYLVRLLCLFPHREPMTFNQDAWLGRLIALLRRLFN